MALRLRKRDWGWGAVLAIAGLVGALYVALVPWSFHIGGRWTAGFWSGYGTLRTAGGNAYPLYVAFRPNLRGGAGGSWKGLRASAALHASGSLCISPGVVRALDLSGTIYGAYLHTEGSLIEFRLSELHPFDLGERQPRRFFDVGGVWRGPNLVMEDDGSWEVDFEPEKRRTGKAGVTFSRGNFGEFKEMCRAVPRN